jgi:hypothetical protein
MTITKLILIMVCLMSVPLGPKEAPKEAKVTPLFSKDLPDFPGKRLNRASFSLFSFLRLARKGLPPEPSRHRFDHRATGVIVFRRPHIRAS